MELAGSFLQNILKSFPVLTLAYEVVKTETLPTFDHENQMSLTIPIGPKYFVWFSSAPVASGKQRHGIYLLEWSRQKRISGGRFYKVSMNQSMDISLFYNTVMYGTWISSTNTFVMEDLYYYKGQDVSVCWEKDKWQIIWTLMSSILPLYKFEIIIQVAPINETTQIINSLFHHVQLRHLKQKASYVNYIMKPIPILEPSTAISLSLSLSLSFEKPCFKSFKKPQYQLATVFKVVKDYTRMDIYKLYVYGPSKTFLFYDYAMIPDTAISFYMKQWFRESSIQYQRNQNLDYLEESDDEDNENKNEKCNKKESILLQCCFHTRFKKWIPVKKMESCRVVHISQL